MYRLGWGEVTIDVLNELISSKIPEGFQLEYKRQLGDGNKVLDAICAMANTFGGLIMVGIDEDRGRSTQGFGAPGPDGLVGVEPSQRSRLTAFCSNRLVPPFDPEIESVDVGDGKVVLAVRIDTTIAPRPLTHNDRVLVRTEAGNRPADLFRLRSLFNEERSGRAVSAVQLNPSAVGNRAFHEDDPADPVIRAVASAPLAATSWRPVLGDTERESLRASLTSSPLNQWLVKASLQGGEGGFNPWLDDKGSTSTRIDLRWQGFLASTLAYPEARFSLDVQHHDGVGATRVDLG